MLKIEVAKRSERSEEVGRERAGEGVVAEAERLQIGHIREGFGRQLAGEPHSGEVELDHGGVIRRAVYSRPSAGGGVREVPEEDTASDGGAEGEKGCAVGGDVGCGGR